MHNEKINNIKKKLSDFFLNINNRIKRKLHKKKREDEDSIKNIAIQHGRYKLNNNSTNSSSYRTKHILNNNNYHKQAVENNKPSNFSNLKSITKHGGDTPSSSLKKKKEVNKPKKPKNSKIKKNLKKIFKWLFILFILISFSIILLLIYFFSTWKIPDLSIADGRHLAQSTKIYDRTGNFLLYDYFKDEKRTNVSITDVSKHLIDATIAIEDKNFYTHKGVVWKSIAKAAYQTIKTGRNGRGASTVTQQVVKNYFLTREKTYERKLKEIVLALKLEKIKTKKEILELYLNKIPYGGPLYGIEEASRAYFAKPAADLTILESAYLAAIPNAPFIYSPYTSKDKSLLEDRKNLILKLMFEQGYISLDELDDAMESTVTFLPLGDSNSMRAPHFVTYVQSRLAEMYPDEEVAKIGLKVYTTLNWEMQKDLENTLTNDVKRLAKYGASNAASITIDNRNGQILSMLGSIDFNSKKIDGQTNVTLSRRQPGSTMKPFAFAELISQGYSPETILWDVPTQFNPNCKPTAKNGGNCYLPHNYNNALYGPISLRKSLVFSLNIPAVKVLYLAGLKEVHTLANNMGLNLDKSYSHYGLSLVLGSADVRPLDIVSAYGVFGNDGVRNEPISILKIVDMNNEEIYYSGNKKGVAVLNENVARVMSDMLTSRSPSSNVYFPNKSVAVKTGTTNDYKDVWTIGYSKKVSMGMWAGNNDNKSMTSNASSTIIAPIWKKMMTVVNKYYTPERFTKPNYNYAVRNKMMLNGNWKINKTIDLEGISIDYVTGHNILHYLSKANIKKGSDNDKAYRNWEYGVQEWLKTSEYSKDSIIKTKVLEIKKQLEEAQLQQEQEGAVIDNQETQEGFTENSTNPQDSNTNKTEKKEEVEKKKVSNEKKLNISISNLENLTRKDKININISLTNSKISKISYYVNSKKVGGNSSSMVFDLSTFLGLKDKNSIRIKVIDDDNKTYEKNYSFTFKI